MVLQILQNDDKLFEYEFPLFAEECDDEKVISKLRKMWREMCDWRDNADCLVRLRVVPVIDKSAQMAAALAINIGEFAKIIALYCNAYLPKTEGLKAIGAIFDAECLSWPRTVEYYSKNGQAKPFLPSTYGVFSFHFYDPAEWAKYSMETIALSGEFVPYDIADYSVLCNAVRECPSKCRPMIWVNPFIAKAFIEAQDSDLNMATMQTYVSSFIINAAFNTDGKIEDQLVSQVWDAMRVFAEEEDAFSLRDMFNSAEHLIQAR